MFGGELVDLTLGNIQQFGDIRDGQSMLTSGEILCDTHGFVPPRFPTATAQGGFLCLDW